MTALADRQTRRSPTAASVETPSGKGRGDENFPVGSFLIRARPARRMSTPSTASPAMPTTSPTTRRSPPTTRSAGSTAWRRVLDGAPGERLAPAAAAMRAQPRRDRRHRPALPRRAARVPPRRDQTALSRLGRSDGVLPLFGLAGRAAIARPARREPRHLAGVGCAVLGAAGAEPSAGLRRGLPRSRPRLPAARR